MRCTINMFICFLNSYLPNIFTQQQNCTTFHLFVRMNKNKWIFYRTIKITTKHDRVSHSTTGRSRIPDPISTQQEPPRRPSLVPLQFHGDWYPWMLLLAWNHGSFYFCRNLIFNKKWWFFEIYIKDLFPSVTFRHLIRKIRQSAQSLGICFEQLRFG